MIPENNITYSHTVFFKPGCFRNLFRFLSLGIVFLLSLQGLEAQNFILKSYNENEGVAQSYIYTIFQDELGFLWAGTGEGLSRFDGNEFHNFTEEDGLAENFVTASLVASDGTVWLGHNEGGITRYDGGLAFHIVEGKDSAYTRINDIVEDKDHNIWVLTQRDGLWKITPEGELVNYTGELKFYLLYNLVITDDGQFYLGTNDGLQIFTLPEGADELEFVDFASGVPETRITSLVPMEQGGGYWVGTEDEGIVAWYPGQKAHVFTESHGLKSSEIQSLCEDAFGYLWVAYGNQGLNRFRYDRQNDTLIILEQIGPRHPINDLYINTLFPDRQGQTWFGTYGNGLVYLKDRNFSTFRPNPDYSRQIRALIQDQSGAYWLGTEEGLLKVSRNVLYEDFMSIDFEGGIDFEPEAHFTVEDGLPGNVITALYEDRNGTIWVGTDNNGPCKLDPSTGEIEKVTLSEYSLYKSVNSISSDHQGNIWFATKGGASCFNPVTFAVREFTTEQGLPHNNIFQTFETSSHEIWFATHSRNIPILRTDSIEQLVPEGHTTVPSAVNSFAEDKNGTAWIASREHGIFVYSKDGNVQNFTTEHGLLSNYCYLIIPDEDDNIWIGHRRGVTKFNRNTGKFVIYDEDNGFPGNVENPNVAILDKDGNFWFGTMDGLVRYDPYKSKNIGQAPNTFISAIYVQDEPRDPNEELTLKFDQYKITFEFFGVSFQDQEQVKYQFKLEGNDLQWSDPTITTTTTYQGLSAGEYSFLVKACNSEGVCNEEPIAFNFVIRPPIWKQWWFISLCVLVGVVCIVGVVRYRIRRIDRERQRLQTLVEARTLELKGEKEKVEVLNKNLEGLVRQRTEELAVANQELSLNNKKLETAAAKLLATNKDLDTLLYRASHDLKQPIASVEGLIYILKMEAANDTELLRYVDMLATSVEKLDGVVQDLVNVSLVTQHNLEYTELDLGNILDAILDDPNKDERFLSVDWRVEMSQVPMKIHTDSYLMKSILNQLLDNAAKFSKKDEANPWCQIKAHQNGKGLSISVADNGIGINEEDQKRLFGMFFHATKDISGSGLGLYLVKAATEKMGGSVSVSSTLGEGSEFVISLPNH